MGSGNRPSTTMQGEEGQLESGRAQFVFHWLISCLPKISPFLTESHPTILAVICTLYCALV